MCRSLVKFVVETRCYCNQWKIGIIKGNVSNAILVLYNKAKPDKCNQCGHTLYYNSELNSQMACTDAHR